MRRRGAYAGDMTQTPDPDRPDEQPPSQPPPLYPPADPERPHGDPLTARGNGYAPPGYAPPAYTPPGYAPPGFGPGVGAGAGYVQQGLALNYNPYAGDVDAPYGYDARTGLPLSDKSKTTAGLLQLALPFFGLCGIGRIYLGDTRIGLTQFLGLFIGLVLMLLLVGFLIVPVIWLWTVIDGILLLTGSPTDSRGRPLRS